jgi:hypothetical protein
MLEFTESGKLVATEKVKKTEANVYAEQIIQERKEESRLKEVDFTDKYSEEEIHSDLEMVKDMKERFAGDLNNPELTEEMKERLTKGRQRVEALEIVLADFGTEMQYFGTNSKIIRTSEFDDIFRGVDIVVEFAEKENNPHRIALAIDASTSPREDIIGKKIRRNIEKITNPKRMPSLKYFRFNESEYVSEKTFILPVVIGLEAKNANRLLKIFARIFELKGRKNLSLDEESELDTRLSEAMNHPGQKIFFEQIEGQFKMYKRKIQKRLALGKDLSENEISNKKMYLEEIDYHLAIVADLKKKKEHIKIDEIEDDAVHKVIQKVVKENMK